MPRDQEKSKQAKSKQAKLIATTAGIVFILLMAISFMVRNASAAQVDLLVAEPDTTVFGVMLYSFLCGFATCGLVLLVRRFRQRNRKPRRSRSSVATSAQPEATIAMDEL